MGEGRPRAQEARVLEESSTGTMTSPSIRRVGGSTWGAETLMEPGGVNWRWADGRNREHEARKLAFERRGKDEGLEAAMSGYHQI